MYLAGRIVHPIDYAIAGVYLLCTLGVGLYFYRRQRGSDDYYVGGRRMGTQHVALSVVATDVGGGFSIGLGGLAFTIGLSASWLLFTGLLGAWLTAVLLIPRVKALADREGFQTYPDFLDHHYRSRRVRWLAAAVSGVGYTGFVGGQLLAGATLASAAFGLDHTTTVLVLAVVAIAYTAAGGLEAVVYTDTIQWAVLMVGLCFVALPLSWDAAGGLAGLQKSLPEGHLSPFEVGVTEPLVWIITIVPIWFVAQTLYQRIYATRSPAAAKRAWYVAGILEYPVIALVATFLGLCARAVLPDLEDPEQAIPALVGQVLPTGVSGLVLAAYFSAILSTADSCLLAASGHVTRDLMRVSAGTALKTGRWVTAALGVLAVGVAMALPNVLSVILLAYGFMVAGLFVPTFVLLLGWQPVEKAAFASMITGGGSAVALALLPEGWLPVDPIAIALPLSAVTHIGVTVAVGGREK